MPELGKLSKRIPEAHWTSSLVNLRNYGGKQSAHLLCSHTSTHTWTHPPHMNTYIHEDIHHTHMPHGNTYVHTGGYIPYAGAYANTYTWIHAHTTQRKNKAFRLRRPHLLLSPKYLHMGSGRPFPRFTACFILGSTFFRFLRSGLYFHST